MTADTWQQFELDSRLRSTRYLLRHGSEHCLSVGDLHAVVTGSGILCVASAGCAVFAAAVLSGAYKGYEMIGPAGRVLWISSGAHFGEAKDLRRALCEVARPNVDDHGDRLRVLALPLIPSEQCGQLITAAVRDVRPTLIVVDNPPDLCECISDTREFSDCLRLLRRLAREYDCAAVYSLRPNLLTPAHHAVANRFTTEVYER